VDQVDRLERPDHHFELDDPALIVPSDQVDTVDGNAVDLYLKLECGARPRPVRAARRSGPVDGRWRGMNHHSQFRCVPWLSTIPGCHVTRPRPTTSPPNA
jgi:hypothetical protein